MRVVTKNSNEKSDDEVRDEHWTIADVVFTAGIALSTKVCSKQSIGF